MPKNEVPPEHLWEDGEGLDLWWKRVEQKREDAGPGGVSPDGEDEELVDNDMGNQFRKLMSDD